MIQLILLFTLFATNVFSQVKLRGSVEVSINGLNDESLKYYLTEDKSQEEVCKIFKCVS